ncbi:MAG: NAD(P)-dependent oxidoreductase [Proteobacteria bacterium]|nr:NAD(P)-dependent oxidoreductase [Pseudomonadota bacterium]
MQQHAIVFGGSGFLGSHVADELTSQGMNVTIFDLNESPFIMPQQNFIKGDILDAKAVAESCRGKDFIYNFAGLADINAAKDNPLLTAQLNIIGQVNVLEGARQAKCKRFIYASTVYVYSESGSFYRISKQAGEKYTEQYWEKYQLPYSILRYGSLYGPRSDHRNAIYRFIESALKEGKIHYSGTGDELREYIHVGDAAKASVDILKPEFQNQHFVITGSQLFRVRDVITMISEILHGVKVEAIFENKDLEAHYNITPYAFKPRLGKKYMVNPFVDMGQGILDCVEQIHKSKSKSNE